MNHLLCGTAQSISLSPQKKRSFIPGGLKTLPVQQQLQALIFVVLKTLHDNEVLFALLCCVLENYTVTPWDFLCDVDVNGTKCYVLAAVWDSSADSLKRGRWHIEEENDSNMWRYNMRNMAWTLMPLAQEEQTNWKMFQRFRDLMHIT